MRWLTLLMSLPPTPTRHRVGVWRKLQRMGAVKLRGAAWILPETAETTELFQWLVQEIQSFRGEATLLRVDRIDTMPDDQVTALFHKARAAEYYAVYLPTMVRTALEIGDRELAERLAAGYDSHYPMTAHALATVNAALAEARGDLEPAAAGYGDAAEGWRQFGVVPELAFALLGRGRCLIALRQVAVGKKAIQAAREIFGALGAASALAETDELLRQATAISA